VRNIAVLSGVLALALLAEPAKADPTSNTLFLVINWNGGFSTGNNEEYEYYSYQSEGTLLMFNLASIGGTFPFIDLSFAGLGEVDLSELEYFIIGEVDGSEHLILSGDGEGEGFLLDDTLEEGIEDNITNLEGDLANPGGAMFLTPTEFGTMVAPIDLFTGPDALFDMTATVGEGMDVIGFTEGQVVGFIVINADGSATFVPEPGLTILALMGIAGTVIARRRRRVAA
jgi:hypothetical protein